MFLQLLAKECTQIFKSIIYWLIVVILAIFFFSQLGSSEIPEKPVPGQENYGTAVGGDDEATMEATLGYLTSEYSSGTYVTYPIGFYKTVKPDDKEEKRIGEIVAETTGMTSKEEIDRAFLEASDPNNLIEYGSMPMQPVEGLTYERFQELMKEVDEILGGGSHYSKESLATNARTSKTYEQALADYDELTQKDHLTGGYARLFSDYMGIMLGILPVFLAATRGMRDRRSHMHELIASRKASSAVIIASRYFSMLIMIMLPILLLSCYPLFECISSASGSGIHIDYFAFVKYSFGWLLPTAMTATAVGMLFTELTDTALGVLVQLVWWFLSIFGSMSSLSGGLYGWDLVLRHNSVYGYQLFKSNFTQLVMNRVSYAILSLLLVAVTIWIYSLKRKGRLDIRGKILGNRERKLQA